MGHYVIFRSIAGRFFIVSATRKAQEYWSGRPIPSPGDLANPGFEQGSPVLQADSLPVELPEKPRNVAVMSALWFRKVSVWRMGCRLRNELMKKLLN